MSKSVYSLVLTDEIVRAIDSLAYRMNTSRSALIDRILAEKLDKLVIVSNNVFEDGISYDAQTMSYIRVLGRVNQELARMADHVTEVIVGIPVKVK